MGLGKWKNGHVNYLKGPIKGMTIKYDINDTQDIDLIWSFTLGNYYLTSFSPEMDFPMITSIHFDMS